MILREVFEGKKILVTGHTGFKGSWLSIWLKELGAEVHGIALEPKTADDNFIVSGLKDKLNHHVCDIKKSQKLQQILNIIKPNMLFHLAGQSLVKEAFDNPLNTYETNLMGTVNILEAIRCTSSIQTAIIVTSDKCYRNFEWQRGYRENDQLGGLDPYGSSKACAELAIDAYRDSFFQNPNSPVIASTRAGNVIGGGDWSEFRIIPDIIRSLISDEDIELRNPESTRPWQFVLEPLSGYLWLAVKAQFYKEDISGAWNFGPNSTNSVTVGELSQKIVNLWGKNDLKITFKKKNLKESTYLSLDCLKARQKLNWQPTLSFDETLEYIVEWYKRFCEKKEMYPVCVSQINDFSQKALARGMEWAK